MLVLFRMKYVLVAFAVGWFCGMYAAFSAKGCGERLMTNVAPIYAPPPAMPPGPQLSGHRDEREHDGNGKNSRGRLLPRRIER